MFEWIVAKALVKDREERYQTAKEMLNDLRRRNRLGVEQEIEKSRSLIGADFDATGNETRAILSAKSTEEFSSEQARTKAPSTRSLSGLLGSLILDRLRTPRSVALSLILLAAFGFGLYRFFAPRWRPAPPFQSMQVRKFTPAARPRARPSRRRQIRRPRLERGRKTEPARPAGRRIE